MAIVTKTDLFEKQLKAVRKRSRIVARMLEKEMKAVEENPRSFEPPLTIPPMHSAARLAAQGIVVRKAYVTHQRHDYRVVFLHKEGKEEDKVAFLYVRSRDVVYDSMDWDMVLAVADDL